VLDRSRELDSAVDMIRGGFLSEPERQALIGIARDGLEEHRIARRANAIILLDKGWNCTKVASALLLDDDTIRHWHRAYESEGLEGLRNFGHEGSACRLSEDQQRALTAWITARLPRSTNVVGAWLKKTYDLSYSRPGLIALLHRLGFDYRTPRRVPRHLDEERQKAFIDAYEKLLNRLGPDEAVVFIDAVHPTHQVRAAGCWAPKGVAIAVEQTTGRQSLNIHGAINLETGQTQMLEVQKVDSKSFIALLKAIEAAHPTKQRIHVFLDNATYHHAHAVRDWIARHRHKSVLHFIPTYCPHLDPIERCWGLMHQFVTHNRDYRTFRQFRRAILKFLRKTVPERWDHFRDRITDNFRVISPTDFRVVA
jgi:transposase